MLTSERKIRKLFIKFLTWDKKAKAINLLETYPECSMPWQKAFECAASNNAYDICLWILDYLPQTQLNYTRINIHYEDDILLTKLENMSIMYRNSNGYKYRDYLDKLLNYDKLPNYDKTT
jgi:hypothetical protein